MKTVIKRIQPLIFLMTVGLVLFGSIYAWMAIGDTGNVDFIQMNVGPSVVESFLYIKENDELEIFVRDSDDIEEILALGSPSDQYRFRVKLNNATGEDKQITLSLENIISHLTIPGVDVRDAYVILDREVIYGEDVYFLPRNSELPELGYEEQPLSLNRLSNLMNSENNIILLDKVVLEAFASVDVVFTLSFDVEISNSAYRGVLEIQKLNLEIEDL